MQGSTGEKDIENRLMDMRRGEERVRYMERCRGPGPAGSRGTLRMNGISERETRRTGLDRERDQAGICSRVWQLLYFLP